MRISHLASLSVLISFALSAQINSSVTETSKDVTDILNNKSVQTNISIAKATSQLEDLNDSDECSSEKETHESCQGFANSLVPQGYKDKGWKTLLEIKYQLPNDGQSPRQIKRARKTNYNILGYYNHNPGGELNTAAELESEVIKIQEYYKLWIDGPSPHDIRMEIIINQLSNSAFNKSDEDMMTKIKNYSSTMNDHEFTRFVSAMADYVGYNDDREKFMQTPEGAQGVVTPFQQMRGTKYGVCGDIHSMAAKIAEQRGWEAFTVGYSVEGMQHVVTALVNPNDPNKLMIVNYGTYEQQALNEGNSITLPPQRMQEIGTQMRIFKNDRTGDPLGKMQQIATIPTALGSFMNDLFKKDYQISKAMPANNNFQSKRAGAEITKHKTKLKNDDNKITDKYVAEGLIIYEGQTDNAYIYGVAVAHNVYKDIYRWDPNQGKCVLKKNKYFSVGLAGSLVDLTQTEFDNTFYAYLNMKGGQILHVYQSEHFQFKGIIGYELEGFAAKYDEGFLTGDGNFSTFLGVVADYNHKGTTIHTGLTYEANAGLRNQNLMSDFSSIPTNVNPMAFNALSLDANATYKIDKKNTLVSNNNVTMTRVGGRVFLSTGIIHNNTSFVASYQGGVKPIPIGNTLQNVNLLQNFNNMDGFRLSVSQQFSNKKGNFSGSVSAYGGMSTATIKPVPMAGATLKVNLSGNKRKPASGK